MAECYISVGSNIERDSYIPAGLNSLRQQFGQLRLSTVYETQAVGFNGAAFYNLVLSFNTALDANSIAQLLRAIEYQHGRSSDSKKFSARTLDLDLLLLGDLMIHSDSLILPRPDITRYAFILEPLADIAPTLIHPLLQRSYAELWQQFDKSQLKQQRVIPFWLAEFN